MNNCQYGFGFIGCGNMGGALASAVAQAVDPVKIAVCDSNPEKTGALVKKYGVCETDIRTLAKRSEFIVLGVKPQAMQATLESIATILKERKKVVLVSMAAGLSAPSIQAMAKGEYPVIRLMPNTPCALGAGMAVYATLGVSETDERAFLTAFQKCGRLDRLEEKYIDAAGALSGSGPAFSYMFAKSLADGAVECGLPEEKAALYAAQTLLGAAEMLLAFGDPETLKNNVCSPNGTTIEGVNYLEKENFREIAKGAVTAAYRRTLELKK